MPTSGLITSNMTARQFAQDAFELLSVYGAGETMTAEDGAFAVRRMNTMLKSWQTDGVNLWRETDRTFSTVASQATYTLDPRPLDIEEASIVSGYQRPLQRWERGEYVTLPNKLAEGIPSVYTIDRNRDDVTITLWPVPNAVMVVFYTADRVIEDVTDLDEDLDVPQAWMECIVYNLATKLYPAFGGERISEIKDEASRLYGLMRDFDRPSSYFMGAR